MSTTNDTKSDGKSGRRKGKGSERRKKAVSQEAVSQEAVSQESLPESPAPAQLQSPAQELQPQPDHAEIPKVDQQPAVEEPVVAVVASPEPQPAAAPSPAEPPPAEPVSVEPSPEPVSAEPASAEPSPAEPAPVSLQTIANAYRDYTRKSMEEFGSFVE